MKTFSLLVALFALTLNARAEEPKALFTYSTGNMLTAEFLTVQILADGHLLATRSGYDRAGKIEVRYNEIFARLNERGQYVLGLMLERVKPGMKLAPLSAEEKRRNEHCASEGGYQYRLGEQVVVQSEGCARRVLADKLAARSVQNVIDIVTQQVSENADRIWGRR